MRQFFLESYRLGSSIPLARVASQLDGSVLPRRQEYMELRGEPLRSLSGQSREDQAVFVFRFGCAVFVNMSETDKQRFLGLLPLSLENPSDPLLGNREAHTLTVSDDGMLTFVDDAPPVIFDTAYIAAAANALAKLSALAFMEERISRIYDDAEGFMARMGRGRMQFRALAYAGEIAKLMRFQYINANNVRVFERFDIADAHIDVRRFYDLFMAAYEYQGRIRILRDKTQALDDIFRLLIPMSQNWQESRTLYAEIFFLAMFPLFYLL